MVNPVSLTLVLSSRDLPFFKQLQPRGRISGVLLPEDIDAKRNGEIVLPRLHGVSNEVDFLYVQREL